MWFLILALLTTPVIAQEVKKVSDDAIEIIEVSAPAVDEQFRDENIARLKEAKANALESAATYQAEIDALENPPQPVVIDWNAIKTISYGGINWVDAATVAAEVDKAKEVAVPTALNWTNLSEI